MRTAEEKARCFHYLHGIDVIGADNDGQLLFACIHRKDKSCFPRHCCS